MSILDEISKIQNAKSDISQAIKSKGVNVPGTAMLSDLSALVEQIPQEGGSIIVDQYPTEGSFNAVSSGGVYDLFISVLEEMLNRYQEEFDGMQEQVDGLQQQIDNLNTALEAKADPNYVDTKIQELRTEILENVLGGLSFSKSATAPSVSTNEKHITFVP